MNSPVPPDVVCAFDYERHARQRLSDNAWAYVSGWAGDGITLRRNREAFDRLALSGRVLGDMRGATTAGELFGMALPFPILLAPVAFQKLVHPDGELATALGASACGAAMCVSAMASATLEDIARVAQAPLIFQLYMVGGREVALSLVRRAEAAGYQAVMITVDAPIAGVRNVEQRAGFTLPPHVYAVNLEGAAKPASRAGPGESPVFKGLLDDAPTWGDIEWLRRQTKLPLIIKGVIHPADAGRAVELGLDGVVVSNHGGRTLDTLPASLDALKAVAARVKGRTKILMDGGVRRGTDVLKALALGADAVMVGQPLMHALAVAGPVGVLHMLTVLHAEFEVAMALNGCAALAEISENVLWTQV